MSLETNSERMRKRIVEHLISGFNTAEEATTIGATIDAIIEKNAGKQKFRMGIAAPDTQLAITTKYKGASLLKTTFLELKDQNLANFICEEVKKTIANANIANKSNLKIEQTLIREKPQPQSFGAI